MQFLDRVSCLAVLMEKITLLKWASQSFCCSPQSLARGSLMIRFVRSSWLFDWGMVCWRHTVLYAQRKQTNCCWPGIHFMVYKLFWEIQSVAVHYHILTHSFTWPHWQIHRLGPWWSCRPAHNQTRCLRFFLKPLLLSLFGGVLPLPILWQ